MTLLLVTFSFWSSYGYVRVDRKRQGRIASYYFVHSSRILLSEVADKSHNADILGMWRIQKNERRSCEAQGAVA